jgi:predicted transcriptional regulator
MPRLSKEEWQAARERWEAGNITHEALALELGVTQQAVSGQAKRNNWANVVDVVNVVSDVVNNVVDVVKVKPKNNEALIESSVDDIVGNVVEDVVNNKSSSVIKSTRGGKREGAGAPPGLRATMKARAAEHGDNCIDVMVGIMKDEEVPANIRIAAADKLLDRGYGKPKQEVEMMGEVNYVDKTLLDDRYSKNMGRTAELGLLAKERIEQLRQGALN